MGVRLIGPQEQFSLELRIFNGICLIALPIVGYNIPFSLVAGFPVTALVFAALFITLCFVYYLVRFRKKLGHGIAISFGIATMLFAVNYFYSGGLQGASLLSFTLTFFMVMVTVPRRQCLFWVLLYLIGVPALLLVEYMHPELVVSGYLDRPSHFMDLASTFTINVLVIFAAMLYLRNAYYREQKRVQEKQQELEVMDREKTKIFSIISHDLRAPLSSIQGYLSLLRNYQIEIDQRIMLEQDLSKTVDATQEMLSNLLHWSKAQLEHMQADIRRITIGDALEPVMGVLDLLAGQKQIRLIRSLNPAHELLADEGMLQMILRNLIGNAIKFTQPGDVIHIRSSLTEGHCLIEVQDNGPGIDPEKQETLFSLNAESTYGTANEKGVGLGLYLCRQYAVAQNGTIRFESMPGEGTSFFLSLPAAT